METNEHEADELEGIQEIENPDDSTNWQEEHKKVVEKVIKARERNKMIREEKKKIETDFNTYKNTHPEVPPPLKEPIKSNEPDYARLAFLEQRGINHPDDIKIVEDEASRLKLSLTDVLGMEHIKGRITTNKEDREAKAGMPSGRGRAGGHTANDVDYYIANPDKRPDNQELAEKVLDAKINSEKQNKFSDMMFTE